jgi:hypothetical protein
MLTNPAEGFTLSNAPMFIMNVFFSTVSLIIVVLHSLNCCSRKHGWPLLITRKVLFFTYYEEIVQSNPVSASALIFIFFRLQQMLGVIR